MSNFITVVIQLPEDEQSRKRISNELMLGGEFHGGKVTAFSADDEITLMEMIEEICDPGDCERARRRAHQIHNAVAGN